MDILGHKTTFNKYINNVEKQLSTNIKIWNHMMFSEYIGIRWEINNRKIPEDLETKQLTPR